MSAVPFYVKINGPVGFWHFSLDVIPAAGFAVSIMCVGCVARALSSVRSSAFLYSENIPQAHFLSLYGLIDLLAIQSTVVTNQPSQPSQPSQ